MWPDHILCRNIITVGFFYSDITNILTFLSVCLYLSVSVSVALSISVSVCACMCVYVCDRVCMCVCACVCVCFICHLRWQSYLYWSEPKKWSQQKRERNYLDLVSFLPCLLWVGIVVMFLITTVWVKNNHSLHSKLYCIELLRCRLSHSFLLQNGPPLHYWTSSS